MNILTYLRLRTNEIARDAGASEEGATATEYVFLVAFIALVIIGGATLLGQNLNAELNDAGGRVGGASTGNG